MIDHDIENSRRARKLVFRFIIISLLILSIFVFEIAYRSIYVVPEIERRLVHSMEERLTTDAGVVRGLLAASFLYDKIGGECFDCPVYSTFTKIEKVFVVSALGQEQGRARFSEASATCERQVRAACKPVVTLVPTDESLVEEYHASQTQDSICLPLGFWLYNSEFCVKSNSYLWQEHEIFATVRIGPSFAKSILSMFTFIFGSVTPLVGVKISHETGVCEYFNLKSNSAKWSLEKYGCRNDIL
ncbi:hypothetical protein [Devosia sp.]|uniref:hypothetical protein n=1 Tax=Devosia sp. TaxID=1871048 RepID=UPI003A8E06F3